MRIRWLLFKQGFKSIFKFKSQFIIIALLSFLASFYLVSTLSTNSRINVLYNDVMVKNGKKFDYEYSKSIGSSGSLVSDSTDTYVMMDDFINNQYVTIQQADTTTTAPNYYISDDYSIAGISDQSHSSFISDAFTNDEWKQAFKNEYIVDDSILENSIKDSSISEGSSSVGITDISEIDDRNCELGLAFSRFGVNQDSGEYVSPVANYQSVNSSNGTFKFGEKSYYNNPYVNNKFVAVTVLSLMNSFTNKLEEYKNTLNSNSSFDLSSLPLAFQYYLKNTSAYNSWVNDIWKNKICDNKDYSLLDDWKKAFIQMDGYSTNDDTSYLNTNKDFAYLYSAFSTIAYKMLDKLYLFEKNLWNNFVSNYTIDESKPYSDQLVAGYNEKYKSQFKTSKNILTKIWSSDDDYSTYKDNYKESATFHMNLDYAYLFGESLDDTNDYNFDNYLINSSKKSLTYKQSLKLYDTYDDEISDSLDTYSYGLRGMLDPITYSINDEKQITSLSIDSDLSIYARYEYNKSFSASRGGLFYDYNDINVSSIFANKDFTQSKKSILTMEKYHQDMAAYITGINVSLREEGNFYDSVSKKTYRFVIIDDNEVQKKNQYFKLIEGTEPASENEILINEQYAMKNNLKLGQSINIAGVWKVVTGYTVDTLSYYPLSDISTSIPDVKSSAIIYLTKKSLNNFASIAGVSDSITMTNYYFVSNDNNYSSSDFDAKIKIYNSLINTNQDRKDISSDILNNTSKSSYWEQSWENGNSFQEFDSTNWNLNWTVQQKFSRTLKIITIIVTIIILLLTFVAIGFAIRKNIQANTSQIAYCKSMGIFSRELSISYIGYSVIIGLIIGPIAWICGSLFQEIIVRMFIAYIATPLYEFNFDYRWLLIVSVAIGLISCLASVIIAIYYNRKPIRSIINGSKVTKLKNKEHKIRKSILPFNIRFDIKVALRGKGSMLTMLITTFSLTLLISLLSFIPAAFEKYISDSKEFFTYKNSYTIDNNTSNLPLSPRSLDAWQGDDWLEENNKSSLFSDSDLSDYMINYYDDISNYNSSTSSTGIFSHLKLGQDSTQNNYLDNTQWLTQYMSSNSIGSSDSFISLLLDSLFSRFANFNGMSLSMGDLEQLQVIPAYASTNADGIKYTSVQERKEDLSKLQALLKNGIPQLLKSLGNFDLPSSDDWRKTLIYLVQSYIPASFSSYLSSDTRFSQFSIGSGTETYVPGKETLATSLDFKDDKNNSYSIDGLSDNQTVYNLKDVDTSKIFLSTKLENEIEQLFDSSILDKSDIIKDLQANGLYENGTLNIPVAVNKSVNQKYNFDESLNYNTSHLILNSTNSKKILNSTLPKGAWVYDDRDYQSFKTGKNVSFNDSNSTIDPFSLEASDFVYQRQFSNDNSTLKMLQGTNMLNSVTTNDDGSLSYDVRSYYNYNNLRVYVPRALLTNNESDSAITYLATSGNPNLDTQVNDDSSPTSNQTGWYKDHVKKEDVPESVRKSWESVYSGNASDLDEYVWVSPYNLKFSKSYCGTNPDERYGEATFADLQNGLAYCFGDSNIGSSSNCSLSLSTSMNLPSEVKNIKLKKVGLIKTFNDGVIVADQKVINTILGNSNTTFIPINNDPFEKSDGTYTLDNGNTLKTYEYKSMSSLLNSNNGDTLNGLYGVGTLFSSGEEALKYDSQPIWYNKKYSTFTEATSVTTAVRGQISGILGFVPSISDYGSMISELSNPYTSIELSSLKVGIIVGISNIMISVAIFAIIGIVIISCLYMMLMADSFVSGFARFIIIMKALGYRRRNIIRSVVGIQSILNIIVFAAGIILGACLTKEVLSIIASMYSISIPFVIIWWVPIAIIGVVTLAYIVSTATVLDKFLRVSPTKIFKE